VARASKEPKDSNHPTRKRGTYRAYAASGTVVWECEDFESGKTQIPFGVSMAMKAGKITDDNGAVIHMWDPWGMFGPKRSVLLNEIT